MKTSTLTRVCRPRHFGTLAEPLESRIAPALDVLSIGGATSGSFTDADGDLITVRISGSAGSIDFADVAMGDGIVNDGEAIFSAAITGASADFAVTFSVDSSGTSDGIVEMGAISASSSIRGIYTVADFSAGVATSSFNLSSYTGPGLSTDGSINVSKIVGDAAGVALNLGSLGADTAINVKDSVQGSVTITKSIAGSVDIGGDVTSLANGWTIGGVSSTGSITVGGLIDTALSSTGAIAGTVNIGGSADGAWTVPSISTSGSVAAGSWTDLKVTGAMGGHIYAQGGTSTITLGSISSKASIATASNLTLNVKSIPAGTEISAGGNLTVNLESGTQGHLSGDSGLTIIASKNGNPFGTIGGKLESESGITINAKSVTNLTALSGDDITVTVTGNITKSSLHGGDSDISLEVGGNVTNSNLLGEGISGAIGGSITNSILEGSERDISLNVGGSITNSHFYNGSENISLAVGGNVVNSHFSVAEDDISMAVGGSVTQSTVEGDSTTLTIGENLVSSKLAGDESDLSVTVGGKIVKSLLFCGSEDVIATVGSDVINSRFHATESSISMTVGGNVISSQLISAGSSGSLNVGGNLMGSSLYSDSTQTLVVSGNMTKTNVTAASGLAFNVMGDLLDSTLVGENASPINVEGDFRAKLVSSGTATLNVTGSVLAKSYVEADILVVNVTGNLDASLTARSLDLAVTGNVGKMARILTKSVNDNTGDNQAFKVGGDFAGRLDVSSSFDTGIGATATLVGGKVLAGAVLNFGGSFGTSSADEFVFGAMLGRMVINSDLATDLTFGGDVNKLIIRGGIQDTIAVTGKVRFLSTGSFFTAADANDGNFTDGGGTVTGNLDTTAGHGTVVPFLTV